MYGGNDGLNTVIPYTDPIYFSSRPNISYQQEVLLPLDAELALNPAMKGLKSLWEQKKVAIIRVVGYPNPDLSHFSAMAKWQTASPAKHINTGWLGRWLDSQAEDAMLAISLGSVLPPMLAGAKRSGSALPIGGLMIPKGALADQCAQLAKISKKDSTLMAAAATSRANDVTIMVFSEFGRRVVGNGSQGTDHGTSGPMFLIGNAVQGGFYGEQPSLKNLYKGDLAVTTDFRSVYATVIEKVLNSPVDPTLGKWSGRINFLN